MRRIFVILVSVILAHACILAQGGSNYSSLGLGDIYRSVGARYEGMAGTAIAMPSVQGINVVNPALLGMSPFTRIQTGYRFAQHQVESSQGPAAQSNGEVDGLLALFAVDTSLGIGVSFGMLPYSNLAYSTIRTFKTYVPNDSYNVSSYQSGDGGISSIYIGTSYRIGPIYVGASTQPLFGQMNYYDESIVSSVSTLTTFSLRTKYLVTGMLYKVGAFTEILPSFNLGGYYASGSNLAFDRTVTRTAFTKELFDKDHRLESFKDTLYKSVLSGESPLPTTLGFGMSYRSGRTQIGLDVESANYSGTTINQRPDATMGSMFRATLGISQQAAGYAPTFFEKWGYRGGIGYVQQYFTFRGQTVHEMFGSVGVDFPLGQSATVDAALQVGFRGPSTGLYEYIGRFSATVSIGEVWFKPFARD